MQRHLFVTLPLPTREATRLRITGSNYRCHGLLDHGFGQKHTISQRYAPFLARIVWSLAMQNGVLISFSRKHVGAHRTSCCETRPVSAIWTTDSFSLVSCPICQCHPLGTVDRSRLFLSLHWPTQPTERSAYRWYKHWLSSQSMGLVLRNFAFNFLDCLCLMHRNLPLSLPAFSTSHREDKDRAR